MGSKTQRGKKKKKKGTKRRDGPEESPPLCKPANAEMGSAVRILSAGGPPLSVQNVCRELVELGDKREREGKRDPFLGLR